MRLVGAVVVAAAVAASAGAAVTQDFKFARKLPVTGTPVAVAISNLGVVGASTLPRDLLVLSKNPTGVTVFDGTSAGPSSPLYAPFPDLFGPQALTTFRDATSGRDDIAIGGTNAVGVGVSNGSGGFTFRILPISGTPTDLAAGDFNGDGRDDLVWIDLASRDLDVALNNGSNFFLPPRGYDLGAATPTGELADGHVTTDADLDLFVATSQGVEIFENSGDGTFGFPIVINLGTPTTSLAAADIDLDGRTDVVVGESNRIEVLHNATVSVNEPTFAAIPITLVAGTTPVGVVAADVTRDSLLDLIVLNRGSGNITTFVAQSPFDFQAEQPVAGFGDPLSVTVGRLDGDAFADIAYVATDSVFFFVGTPAVIFSAPGGLPFSPVPSFKGSTGHKQTPPETITPPKCSKTLAASCSGKYFWDVNVPLNKKPVACGIFNVKTNRDIKNPLFAGVTQKRSCKKTNRTRVVHGERKRIVHVELSFETQKAAATGSARVRVEVFWK
jgi:hypothetical protein